MFFGKTLTAGLLSSLTKEEYPNIIGLINEPKYELFSLGEKGCKSSMGPLFKVNSTKAPNEKLSKLESVLVPLFFYFIFGYGYTAGKTGILK